jgi:hypothetical protein
MKTIALLLLLAATSALAQDDGSPGPAPTPIPLPTPVKIVAHAVAAPAAPAALQAAQVSAGDIATWQAVTAFLKTPPPQPTGGSWLDAARIALTARIQHEGYTADTLAAGLALMQKARAQ